MRRSEQDRDEAIDALRAACAQGYLSVPTLELRIERAYLAHTVAELRGLTSDLPQTKAWHTMRRLARKVRRRRAPAYVLPIIAPGPLEAPLVIGRSRTCDTILREPSISRRHLELRPIDDHRWLAVDLGSTNGTWFLGRRVARVVVEHNDELTLGHTPIIVR